MKKLILVPFLLFSVSSFSQTEKGKQIFGGTADMSMSFQGKVSTFFMNFSPSFGVFAVKNFAIGGRYSFGINSRRAPNDEGEYRSTTTFTTAIGPLAKYYFGKKQMKGFISANGSYLVNTTMTKGNVTNRNGYTAGGALGCAYFFNEHVGLETAFYVQLTGYESGLPNTRGGISVGVFTFLDRKKKE